MILYRHPTGFMVLESIKAHGMLRLWHLDDQARLLAWSERPREIVKNELAALCVRTGAEVILVSRNWGDILHRIGVSVLGDGRCKSVRKTVKLAIVRNEDGEQVTVRRPKLHEGKATQY